MEWFEEWFDSPLYEKMYAKRDEDEANTLANLVEKIIPVNVFHDILDLGCGRGRHSINMAKRGYKVTGIDLSRVAIEKAQIKAKNLGLDIEFLVGDMRDPLSKQFSAILNLFTSFGYFDDDEENFHVLKAERQMLKNNGIVVIDYLNAIQVEKNIIPEENGKFENISFEIKRYIERDTINKEMTFFLEGNSEARSYHERVKLYPLSWFESHVEKAGMSIMETFGNYNGTPFNADKSPRLIMICKA